MHRSRLKVLGHRRFQEGTCTFGDKCNYAHGEAELRSLAPEGHEILAKRAERDAGMGGSAAPGTSQGGCSGSRTMLKGCILGPGGAAPLRTWFWGLGYSVKPPQGNSGLLHMVQPARRYGVLCSLHPTNNHKGQTKSVLAGASGHTSPGHTAPVGPHQTPPPSVEEWAEQIYLRTGLHHAATYTDRSAAHQPTRQ